MPDQSNRFDLPGMLELARSIDAQLEEAVRLKSSPAPKDGDKQKSNDKIQKAEENLIVIINHFRPEPKPELESPKPGAPKPGAPKPGASKPEESLTDQTNRFIDNSKNQIGATLLARPGFVLVMGQIHAKLTGMLEDAKSQQDSPQARNISRLAGAVGLLHDAFTKDKVADEKHFDKLAKNLEAAMKKFDELQENSEKDKNIDQQSERGNRKGPPRPEPKKSTQDDDEKRMLDTPDPGVEPGEDAPRPTPNPFKTTFTKS